MRPVLFVLNISIDGCYEHTFARPDDEMMDYFTRLMQLTGTIVYGRKTYELMVPYWPDVAKNRTGSAADIAFADALNNIEKIVLSRTLKHANERTRIVSENPEGLIKELKQQPGKAIALSSTSLFPSMLAQGLIDELYLVLHPIILGSNKRLFDNLITPESLNFALAEQQVFKSGAMALHYRKLG